MRNPLFHEGHPHGNTRGHRHRGNVHHLASVDGDTVETGVLKVASTTGGQAAGVIQALKVLADDYSRGIFDASGNMVAQGPVIPIHPGSMPLTVKAILATFERFAPGVYSFTVTRTS